MNRFLDWFRQAEADLNHARSTLSTGGFEWSCFAAQQSAEKALKAVYLKQGKEAWGHTVTILLGELGESVEVSQQLLDRARSLDKHYVPTRYPNGFEAGAPTDYYTRQEAERAIGDAEEILEFCRHQIV